MSNEASEKTKSSEKKVESKQDLYDKPDTRHFIRLQASVGKKDEKSEGDERESA